MLTADSPRATNIREDFGANRRNETANTERPASANRAEVTFDVGARCARGLSAGEKPRADVVSATHEALSADSVSSSAAISSGATPRDSCVIETQPPSQVSSASSGALDISRSAA
jgi:hypothetical protein